MERVWVIVGGALLAALLIASVVIALARGDSEFEPGSPEYAVQQYLRALVRDEFETAEALWSPDLREACSFQRFRVVAQRSLEALSESRVTLEDVEAVDATTIVSVRLMRTVDGGLFGPSESFSSYRYAVREFEGAWRISSHTWPANECLRDRFDSVLDSEPPSSTPAPPATPVPRRAE